MQNNGHTFDLHMNVDSKYNETIHLLGDTCHTGSAAFCKPLLLCKTKLFTVVGNSSGCYISRRKVVWHKRSVLKTLLNFFLMVRFYSVHSCLLMSITKWIEKLMIFHHFARFNVHWATSCFINYSHRSNWRINLRKNHLRI